MKIVANDPVAAHRIAESAGVHYRPGHDVSFVSCRSDGTLLGGVILNEYTGTTMHIHAGSFSEHWMIRDLLWLMFHYPFVQLNVRSLIAPVRRGNTHAMSFVGKVGFDLETVIRDYYPGGDDLMIMRMWADKCRWLSLKPREISFNQASLGVH